MTAKEIFDNPCIGHSKDIEGDIYILSSDAWQTIKAERDEMIKALVKVYPEVSEEWEDDNDLHISDIIERATGKPIEEAGE